MQQPRKPPLKRHSSYHPPNFEILPVQDRVSSSPGKYRTSSENDCVASPCDRFDTAEKSTWRRSTTTPHFDALQSAVSKLSRMDDYDMEELGYGFFSDVFKVTHKQSGKIMVLKRNKSTNTKMNILREVQLMNRLAHPNILKFMGVCVHEGQLHALTEFLNGGDLDQLVQQKNTYLSWLVRIRLALDVAKGLTYLHSMGIFHRDLTAKNCLVRVTTNLKQKKRYSAVVADLGLAEKIPTKPEDQARLRVVGTPYCMAPEVLRDKPYDEKSDFFSFGLIICQLIIRTPTDPEKLPRSNEFGLKRDIFHALVKKGVGSPEAVEGTLPPSMPPSAFLQLAYDCCEVDPLKRPGVKEIVCSLKQIEIEEKAKLVENREPMLPQNAPDVTKRHSFALTDLPSMTSRRREPSELPAEKAKREVEAEEKNSTSSASVHKTSRLGTSSRLSRSQSDLSNELISHAVSIIASSQGPLAADPHDSDDDMSEVLQSLNEAFINPFDDLEKSELLEAKLFDLPSSDVLEMAFDLPAPKLLSPRRLRRPRIVSERPKGVLFDTSFCESPLTNVTSSPELLYSHPCKSVSCESNTPALSPKRTPAPGHAGDGICPQIRHKHALVRSVAFSPQGKRLVSWWHSHGRVSDRRSLASVLAIMTERMGGLKKSISVPDLSSHESGPLFALTHKAPASGGSSRSSSISSEKESPRFLASAKAPSGVRPHPYPAYVTLPRKKKARCPSSDAQRRRRSKTSGSVSQDDSLLDILPEETANSKQFVRSPCFHASEDVFTGEINDNESPVVKKRVVGLKSADSPHIHPACAGPVRHSQEEDEMRLSTSSTSSGASSTDLRMSLQSGIVCSNRRKTTGGLCNKESALCKSKSSSCEPFDESSKVHPTCDASIRCDRDSGYNEDAFSTDNSCDSQSAVNQCVAPLNPALVRSRLPDYAGRVTPTCKVIDCADASVKLIGESH